MKLHELIEELNKFASDAPDAEVEFQTIDMASVWFKEARNFLIVIRKSEATGGKCVITIGPHESLGPDYKKFADTREQQRR